jgi:hypothetical protein
VVLSKAFFRRGWPQYELDGLVQRESEGAKVVLPVWHGVSRDDVANYSPSLAGRVSVRSTMGIDLVAKAICKVAKPTTSEVYESNSKSEPLGRLDLLRNRPKNDTK